MKKMRFRRKNVKSILSAILVVAVVVGVFAGLNSLSERDLKSTRPVFTLGALNEEGKYIESEGTIYTKEAFECQGLEIKLDFEKTIFYEVYYYNSNGEFLYSSEKSNENSKPELPARATHARIVITPDWELLEVKTASKQKIKWYEIAKYANQIEIKVNAVQEEIFIPYQGVNKMTEYSKEVNITMQDGTDGFKLAAGGAYNSTNLIMVENATTVCIKVRPDLVDDIDFCNFTKSGYNNAVKLNTLDYDEEIFEDGLYITFDIPKNCYGFCLYSLKTVDFSDCEIYTW